MNKIERYLSAYKNVFGKTFIVTGANSGLGYATVEHLASLGAIVIMACRQEGKALEAKHNLLQKYPQANLEVIVFDQADFVSINAFVDQVMKQFSKVDCLILNAGIYHPRHGLVTKQGFPLTMGTNYLGVYYLLKRFLQKGFFDHQTEQRIVLIGSLSWYRVRLTNIEDILTTFFGDNTAQYCRSKTAIGILAYHLSTRQNTQGIILPESVKVTLMHPGITSTNIVGSMSSSFPAWFSYLAHKALYLFTHHPRVAALGVIDLALNANLDPSKIIVPRGLFHLSGYPKKMAYPKNLKENSVALLKTTEKVIASHIEENEYVRS